MSRLGRWLQERRNAFLLSRYRHLRKTPRFRVVTDRLLGKPFRIPDGPSFYAGYREIFIQELYRFETSNPAPVIIDCGANCGLSVVYFKQLFPAAKIVAVEADPIVDYRDHEAISLGMQMYIDL